MRSSLQVSSETEGIANSAILKMNQRLDEISSEKISDERIDSAINQKLSTDAVSKLFTDYTDTHLNPKIDTLIDAKLDTQIDTKIDTSLANAMKEFSAILMFQSAVRTAWL